MSRSALPLKIRVRYEGLYQTFDRRPQAEIQANFFRSPIRRTVSMGMRRPEAKGPRLRKTTQPSSKMSVPVPSLSAPMPSGQPAAA
jgi:hypothetical protein